MTFAHTGESHEPDGMLEMMRSMMGGELLFMGAFWIVFGLLLFALVALGVMVLLKYLKKGTEELPQSKNGRGTK